MKGSTRSLNRRLCLEALESRLPLSVESGAFQSFPDFSKSHDDTWQVPAGVQQKLQINEQLRAQTSHYQVRTYANGSYGESFFASAVLNVRGAVAGHLEVGMAEVTTRLHHTTTLPEPDTQYYYLRAEEFMAATTFSLRGSGAGTISLQTAVITNATQWYHYQNHRETEIRTDQQFAAVQLSVKGDFHFTITVTAGEGGVAFADQTNGDFVHKWGQSQAELNLDASTFYLNTQFAGSRVATYAISPSPPMQYYSAANTRCSANGTGSIQLSTAATSRHVRGTYGPGDYVKENDQEARFAIETGRDVVHVVQAVVSVKDDDGSERLSAIPYDRTSGMRVLVRGARYINPTALAAVLDRSEEISQALVNTLYG